MHGSDLDRAWLYGRADGELVRIGHATAQTERVIAGGRAIEIARIKITEAGRRALTDKPMQ